MLQEIGMAGEIIVLAMLQDEDSAFLQQIARHDDIGNFFQIGQGIGRVSKDEVELLIATGQITEHITTNGYTRLILQFFKKALDETMMKAVLLNRDHARTTTREKLQCDAACAREKIESCRSFLKVKIALKHIEKVLLGKIGCGSSLKRTRYVKVATFVFSRYYTHSTNWVSSPWRATGY